MKSKKNKEKIIRETILHNALQNQKWTQAQMATRILERYIEECTQDRETGSGRKKGSVDKIKAAKVKRLWKLRGNISVWDTALRIGTYKVQKVADRTFEKNQEAKIRARKLCEDFVTKFNCCVMENETYVKADLK